MFVKKLYDAASDKSQKKAIDSDILPLVEAVNRLEDFYTTSSCSGRTVLLEKRSRRKCDAVWIYSTHKRADFDDVKKALSGVLCYPVWFKQEAMILHVACRSVEHAVLLMNIARESGFRKCGIISAGERVVVEVLGSDRIDTIVADKGRVLADDGYLRVLVDEANVKMDANRARISRMAELVNCKKL